MIRSNLVPFGWKDGRLVRVDTVPNGLHCGCICPSCESLLIAVNNEGIHVTPHFRHSNPSVSCEGYIHETAKVGLAQMLSDAIAEGQPVPLNGHFRDCGHRFTAKNLLNGVTNISVERRIREPNIQPDILLENLGVPAKTIEVVDKHPPEVTVIAYARDKALPLAIVEVHTEDDLETLLAGFPVQGAKVVVPVACPTCEAEQQRRQEQQEEQQKLELWQKERREEAEQLVTGAVGPGRSKANLRRPETDRFGANLKHWTKAAIMANARKLQALGFQQQEKRATLFLAELPGWKVYADLDSTEVIRIWEVGCIPALYAFPKGKGPVACRECLLEAVECRLGAFNLEYRRHFEDTEGHTCYEPQLR